MFLYVQERASIGARYHVAVFREFIPRLWAINIGTKTLESGRTVEDVGHWFEREDRGTGNCIALKHLAEGDEALLRDTADSHQRAQARRVIIFECRNLVDADAAGSAIDEQRRALYQEHLTRATPLPATE